MFDKLNQKLKEEKKVKILARKNTLRSASVKPAVSAAVSSTASPSYVAGENVTSPTLIQRHVSGR